jgi:hypothetical protein
VFAAVESLSPKELKLIEPPMRERLARPKEKQRELHSGKESPEQTTIWLERGSGEKLQIDGTLARIWNALPM